jgi:hypothetical protein
MRSARPRQVGDDKGDPRAKLARMRVQPGQFHGDAGDASGSASLLAAPAGAVPPPVLQGLVRALGEDVHPSEVRERIGEIAEADAIGDPSLLCDRLAHRERIALETYRDEANKHWRPLRRRYCGARAAWTSSPRARTNPYSTGDGPEAIRRTPSRDEFVRNP